MNKLSKLDSQRQSIADFFETFSEPQPEFKFTFETEQEQFDAERTGYIEAYDCVRMEITYPDGRSLDFPLKNRESYDFYRKLYSDSITKIYPTVHSYDIQDYQ